ncbi:juvenile hormone esterase-like [Hetaerina americana]|uniref:juvenile hormone esterase-like n=1 Tax=Hetaerina americana TaxID=62018 RepID=UPI003A7F2BD4
MGVLRGTRGRSYNGRPMLSFRGIPYAKPPIGDLRFAPPKPLGPWEGVLDATRDAPVCIQKNYLLAGYPVQGQEDCLYLNVYVPLTRQKPKGRHGPALLPVMVYVHGGGWFSGTGASSLHGPEYLVDRDVVLVTFNYRLGAMGFLSTEDGAATGNWALKDQVMVLQWVNKYIRHFGGNAASVTLFGQSAGAASVHYHMLSPMSQGLFHRAITQSGSALSPWAWPRPNSRDLAQQQGRLVGCNHLNTAELVACLRKVSAHNITESGAKLKVWSVDPLTVFAPVVETGCPDEPFLTDHPLVLVATGKYNRRMPWMTGVVPGEGVVRAAAILSDPELLKDLNARLDSLGPFLFELEKSVVDPDKSPGAKDLWSSVADHYLKTSKGTEPHVGEDTTQGFVDAYTDRGFLHAMTKAIQLHLRNSHSPVYFYEFTFRGSISWSTLFAGNNKDYGVSHCDDLLYLFHAPALFPDFAPGTPETNTVDLMVTLWTNFAKFGNPTPKAIRGVTWPPVTPSNPRLHLDVGAALQVKEALNEDRLAFWDSLTLVENALSSPVWTPGTHPGVEGRLRPDLKGDCPAK